MPLYYHRSSGKRIPLELGSRRSFDELYNIKKRHDAKEEDKQRALEKQNQAKMLGTSTNKLEQCVDLTRDLAKFQDTFHKHMTAFSERRTTRTRLRNKKLNDTNRHINTAKVEKLEFEFNNFKL
ncbi:unnamed protein product [Rhizophagus irregularis]|nr:unnamed protein product [Rhizophagus irregularis]